MQSSAAPNIYASTAQPEISRVLRLDDITTTSNTIMIEANVRECMALAVRFDLPYVRSFSAEVTYRRARSGQIIRIDGRITAVYGQTCGATLTAMPMVMEESFQTEYTLSAWEKFSEFDLDQPEILTDDFVDAGEVAAQYFGLAIDPYARRSGGETLPELAQYLSEAVHELISESPSPQPPTTTHDAPQPQVTVLDIIESEIGRVSTSVSFVRAPDEISDTANFVPETPPDTPTPEPELNPQPPEEPPYESLFMKYLRQLRSI